MRIKLPRLIARIKFISVFIALNCWVLGPLAIADALPVTSGAASEGGVFWAINKDGQEAGYVLGTIHSEDPRVLEFSTGFLNKLNSTEVYAMEMVPDVPTMHKLTKYMNYQDGTTLESVIGSGRFSLLTNAMSSYQIPESFIQHMKPWAAMMTISAPPPKTGFFMDLSLSLRASGNNIKVIGLETLEQQLSFLQEMPMDMQMLLLDQAIAEVSSVELMQTELVDAYLENDLQNLQSITDEEFESVGHAAKTYFFEHGIDKRNQRMVATLLPVLATQKVFVAVGALHLPGDQGLLQLLRSHGYQLTPQALPFVD